MTEHAWFTSSNPVLMLAQISGQANRRKLRLFACACCRRVEQLFADSHCQRTLETIETLAQNGKSSEAVIAAVHLAEQAESRAFGTVRAAARAVATAWATPEHSRSAAALASGDPDREAEIHADLLREIFGNPFRSEPIKLSWLHWNDGCVDRMARTIYHERRFEDMPILGDALEEAGCTSEAMLAHCRRPFPHVLGCWVLDALIGAPVWCATRGSAASAYTIERAADGKGEYIRQTSSRDSFARLSIHIESMGSAGPVSFVNAAPVEANAHRWLEAIENGIRAYLEGQAALGRRLCAIRIALTSVVEQPVDSHERAFQEAASRAMTAAFESGRLRLV